jgi:hypothetical protein
MATLHPDLLLLATVAQAYTGGQVADNLYCLAQYGTHFPPPMSVGDMQAGLSMIGLDSYRLVAPGMMVPDIIQHAIREGHIALGQVRGYPLRKTDYWIALCEVRSDGWNGIGLGLDWSHLGVASHMGHILTGFYLVCATPLPGWGG